MKVYSKKAFEFENEDGEKAKVKMADFAEVPDWVEKTPLFELASKCEPPEIMIINGKEDEKKVENPKETEESKSPGKGK